MRPFTAADILLPGPQADLSAWAVLACDQFTSTPAYWQQVQAARKGKPSALDIILPECYLEKPDTPARIKAIHANMKEMAQKALGRCVHGFVYVERTTQSGVPKRISFSVRTIFLPVSEKRSSMRSWNFRFGWLMRWASSAASGVAFCGHLVSRRRGFHGSWGLHGGSRQRPLWQPTAPGGNIIIMKPDLWCNILVEFPL